VQLHGFFIWRRIVNEVRNALINKRKGRRSG
jgi:hypothetical protein